MSLIKLSKKEKPVRKPPADKFDWEAIARPVHVPEWNGEYERVAAKADRLRDDVLGAGEVFPCTGEPLRKLWYAAKGDKEVREFLMKHTFAGRLATIEKEERAAGLGPDNFF